MRSLALLLLTSSAFAAQTGVTEVPVLPSPVPHYRAVVHPRPPSPQWTQDRSFTSTRFWLLDPGTFEVEMWLRTRVFPEVNGVRAPYEILWQHEIEMGVWPHLQIDLYENITFNAGDDGKRGIQQEGNQIEARIAIPSYYGQYFGNPVIYLEWHPRRGEPDRAEVRLLMGGAPTRWFYLAVNPYVETNIEPTDIETAVIDPITKMASIQKSSKFIADMEFGTTVAAGFRVTDWLRLSAEMKIGADMLGDENNQLHFVWFLGPGFILKPLPPRYRQYLKIMGTCLFAMPGANEGAQAFEPLFIIGSQF
jgi:hypothetical protein